MLADWFSRFDFFFWWRRTLDRLANHIYNFYRLFFYLGDVGKEKKEIDIKEKRKSEVKEEENETKKIKLENPETPTEEENKEKKKKKKKMKSYLDDLWFMFLIFV